MSTDVSTATKGGIVPAMAWRNGGGGSPMCVKASGKPVFDTNGEFRGYRGTCTDVDSNHARATSRGIVADSTGSTC
jgi:hypothetical protein